MIEELFLAKQKVDKVDLSPQLEPLAMSSAQTVCRVSDIVGIYSTAALALPARDERQK